MQFNMHATALLRRYAFVFANRFSLLLLFPSSKFSFWPYMRSQPRLYVFKYAVKYGEREKKNAETDVCALFVHMEIT